MNVSVRILIVISIVLVVYTWCSAQYVSDNNSAGYGGDSLVIKLVTIGPGDDLTSWWGHTAIIVDDNTLHLSRFYNYGLFSFEQDNFVTNFAMGRLIFWVGAWNTTDALEYYVNLNRDIRFQILNIVPEKRAEIARLLATNILPENREYLYDHYRDNCSTRVRDLFDRVLGGQFYSQMQIPSTMTFRDHTRRHTDHHFIVDWLLMFLMNNTIDQEIRRWDDMFLPEELERNVADFTYKDDTGEKRKLVKSNYHFFQAKNRESLPEGVPVHWPTGLLIGLTSAVITIIIAIGYKRQIHYMRQLFGVFHLLIGIVYGIPGLALFFMSFFTDHVVTYHNENMLLANPFTLLLIPLGIGITLNKSFSLKWSPILWYFLCGLTIILLILKIFPVFDQQNWLSISMIMPLNLTMAFSWSKIIDNITELSSITSV
jgi:hypothetical protein